MIEVFPNLFVGKDEDVPEARDRGFSILHCAKDPWWRDAVDYLPLRLGDPEYQFALRNREMYLNLVDAPFAPFRELALVACEFLKVEVPRGPVLVHCNVGQSRGPTIALIFLRKQGLLSLEEFRKIYPKWCPGEGMKKLFIREVGEGL